MPGLMPFAQSQAPLEALLPRFDTDLPLESWEGYSSTGMPTPSTPAPK